MNYTKITRLPNKTQIINVINLVKYHSARFRLNIIATAETVNIDRQSVRRILVQLNIKSVCQNFGSKI